MLVVPLKGDVVRVEGGVKYTVLSYAAYKKQPAVYVDAQGIDIKSIPFTDIKSINGTPVALTPSKVFRADSLLKRKMQLPQPGDSVFSGGKRLKVRSLKLRDATKLTDGIILICDEEETGKSLKIRLSSVDSIDKATASGVSSVNFSKFYKDYLGQ